MRKNRARLNQKATCKNELFNKNIIKKKEKWKYISQQKMIWKMYVNNEIMLTQKDKNYMFSYICRLWLLEFAYVYIGSMRVVLGNGTR